jgi:hypothetical protein
MTTRIQVFHHGRWGWICADDSWDSAAAEAQLFIDYFLVLLIVAIEAPFFCFSKSFFF